MARNWKMDVFSPCLSVLMNNFVLLPRGESSWGVRLCAQENMESFRKHSSRHSWFVRILISGSETRTSWAGYIIMNSTSAKHVFLIRNVSLVETVIVSSISLIRYHRTEVLDQSYFGFWFVGRACSTPPCTAWNFRVKIGVESLFIELTHRTYIFVFAVLGVYLVPTTLLYE